MDDPAGIILDIAILLILILINAFFAMSEIAIISLNDNKMRKMAEEGHKGAAFWPRPPLPRIFPNR